MDNPIIWQAGGGLAILFFLVVTYMVTKIWRAPHVIFFFLTFSVSVWFLCTAALSHKTHVHWRKQYDQLKSDLGKAENEILALMTGVRDESNARPETVLSVRGKLQRAILDRGRVWTNCTPGQAGQGGVVEVRTSSDDAAAARPNRIDKNSILYLFEEAEDPDTGNKLPVFYLGEFQAMAVTDTSVTVAPTNVKLVLPDQAQKLTNPSGATWRLYEMLPVDGHLVYARDPHADISLTNVENERIFGEMDEELVTKLYGQSQIGKDILRDGKPITTRDTPPSPENVYVKVEFLKTYKVTVDSDAGQGALNSNYFDSQGQAVVQRLRRGEDVTFAKGKIGVFPKEDADKLIDGGFCKPVTPIFVRTLRDFAFDYHELLARSITLAHDHAEVTRNTAALTDAQNKAKAQVAYRTQEQTKLTADKANFLKELATVRALRQQLERKQARLQTELAALYQTNKELVARLEARSSALKKQIDARTTAATPPTR